MVGFIKTKTIHESIGGKKIHKNSFVKFKTFKGNDQIGLTHEGSLNQNKINPELINCLVDMKEGDKIQLEVSGNQEQRIILEVISVKQAEILKQKFQEAEIFKLKGNQLVKAKNYQEAAKIYAQGLNLIEQDFRPESQSIKISLLSNLTLAYLNTKQYQLCLKTCDQYLSNSLEPNKKIIYRRANANKNLKKWEQAQNDIVLGLSVCQGDKQSEKDFENLSQAIKKQKKIQSQKQKKVYSKMFG